MGTGECEAYARYEFSMLCEILFSLAAPVGAFWATSIATAKGDGGIIRQHSKDSCTSVLKSKSDFLTSPSCKALPDLNNCAKAGPIV
jgi:hypothetical protein